MNKDQTIAYLSSALRDVSESLRRSMERNDELERAMSEPQVEEDWAPTPPLCLEGWAPPTILAKTHAARGD